jgi:transposase InsO family protein
VQNGRVESFNGHFRDECLVGPDEGLARLIRDRDKIFGAPFGRRVDNLGLTQLRIAPRSPWQNGFAERWVGSIRSTSRVPDGGLTLA